ncbi:hypothetical protein Sjap_025194 [Stephania japonica]|uniref:non-specific serine/threonine protein kinase n=1 Tax=Stephania japonica TaxID=461633 RepID=A0AAP0E4E3_9MAGN
MVSLKTKALNLNQILGFCLVSLMMMMNQSESQCSRGCNLALGSYNIWRLANLSFISEITQTPISRILNYNPQIRNQDTIITDERLLIPFSCDCINGDFLGHVFAYLVRSGDTYERIARLYYANLTTVGMLERFNGYPASRIPDGATVNVTVNCYCGDGAVSREYGLFVTYPLRSGESLLSVANATGVSDRVLRDYNRNANFNGGSGVVFVPGRDQSGRFPPLESSKSAGISAGAIAGIAVAVIAAASLLVAVFIYRRRSRRMKREASLLPSVNDDYSLKQGGSASNKAESFSLAGTPSSGVAGISVDKSVVFSYEELARATDDFNLANKIGQGGFGSVYYAELRGEKAAIKKMDMEATKEFLAELTVLTNVHHLNLVRLIGYCVEGSLFLVYEYIENGNLSQHLRGTGREPLPWSTRMQIALDSARGLEYIHEHTVPVYIHRDIKSANILIDKNFHGKVADFGLSKLTAVGSASSQTRLVGTFGYMPPEYAQYGDVSPKIDVYAFGVVLYELISAKEAIVKSSEAIAESRGLFDAVLAQPALKDELSRLIDPRLGDNYPFESVLKMAQLARACTLENPQLRPPMRSIVVALMTLSSSTEDWDIGSFYENQAMLNLMSGR